MTDPSAGQGQPSQDEPTSYPDETVVSPWSAPAPPQGGPIPQPPTPQGTPYPGAQAPEAVQPQYPGAQPAYPAAQPQYPAAQPQYPGAQPENPGAQPQYPGAQPQYPGAQHSAAQPQYPGAQPQYPGAQPGSAQTPYPAPPYPGGPSGAFPGAPQAGPAGPRVAPQNIQTAFYVMLAGAIVTVLSALYSLTTISDLRAEAERSSEGALSESGIDMIVYGALGGAVIGALITAGLWVWMAFANRAGKNWARITSTVFFGLNVLFYLFGLVSLFTGVEGQLIPVLFSTVILAIGIGALVLLWNRKSAWYFAPPPPIGYLPYPGYPPTA
ncbi:hypothetical protein [Nocardia mangyaensis]|uniref:hypothetical protein n=1 Tax=Nocardia mangyaensis TaxID=2213200 RepID=UPI002676FFDF|nr:hypothetical protein [Nocardia mangyaensis]MDO3645561.1 hypothetical protein [Nocardia mangyaensis]